MDLAATRDADNYVSQTAVCYAHPMILRAALRYGKRKNIPILIEATCNQVNHEGGYTGMRPQDFVDQVKRIVRDEQFDLEHLILGGDHLGPNPWRKLDAVDAMKQAILMAKAFAQAGFNKFHLDASMRCADDPEILEEEEIARRAARLAKAIEEVCKDRQGLPSPVYIIGTEVPPPGGANHVLDTVLPTDPEAALNTVATHRKVFSEAGLDDAFARVVGLVVQPGVEFGDVNVHQYKPENATGLSGVLEAEPALCFEAHSTDYQSAISLERLARDGYRIQKVGPWLSFALREALYGLDLIASELNFEYPHGALKTVMETLMLEHQHWQDHYLGSEAEQYLSRHYSYSDRIRYYWTSPKAEEAVNLLLKTLSGLSIPETLISQYLPPCWCRSMSNSPTAETLVLDYIELALANYPTAGHAAAA